MLLFIGHKHVPSLIVIDTNKNVTMINVNKSISFRIDTSKKIIVNVGSVGAIRVKTLDYSYAKLDTDNKTIELIVQ